MTDFINNFINSMTQKLLIIGSSLNIEPNIVQQVNPVIAPMILGGLKKQSDILAESKVLTTFK